LAYVFDQFLPEEGQHWISPTHLCRLVSGQPKIHAPGKCAGIGWFFSGQVPAELTVIPRRNFQHPLERPDRHS